GQGAAGKVQRQRRGLRYPLFGIGRGLCQTEHVGQSRGIVQGSVTNETEEKRLASFLGRGLRQDGQNAGRGTEISRGLGLEPRRRPSIARSSSPGQKILSYGKTFLTAIVAEGLR